MKRTLLTAITLYLLVVRQKRVEARTKAWQRQRGDELARFSGEVNDELRKFVKEIESAFKGIAGGER